MKNLLFLCIISLLTITAQTQNTGIGTTTPQATLDVKGSGTNSSTNTFVLKNNIGDTLLRMRDDGRMGIGYNGTGYGRTINMQGTGINLYDTTQILGGAIFPTDTSLVLWSNNGANNYVILQPSWGKVGIGTYSPDAKLHVEGTTFLNGNAGIGTSSPYSPLTLNNSFGQKISLYGTAGNNHGLGVQNNLLQIHTDAAASDIVFGYGSSNSMTETMRIKGNGNVGVGVDPVFRLDVGARMRIRSTPGLTAGLWLNDDINTTSPAFIGMRANDEVGFYGQTGTAGWRFYINTTTGNGWMQGTLTQASDARLKKDISRLQNPLQKIIQLNGYTYHWKNEQSDKNLQTGVLAQEVQKLFPELVSQNKDGMLAVNYSGLIPVMIESIKEQQKQIDTLESNSKGQQQQIDELKKMVEKLLKQ